MGKKQVRQRDLCKSKENKEQISLEKLLMIYQYYHGENESNTCISYINSNRNIFQHNINRDTHSYYPP